MKFSHSNDSLEKKLRESEVLASSVVRVADGSDEFRHLVHRADDDPMRLHGAVIQEVKNYFSSMHLTFLPGQLECLSAAVKTMLTAKPGTIIVCPLAPGGGKSSLLRTQMAVFAKAFSDEESPIARRLGGVILVVEKSAEGHEYESLCNRTAGRQVAVVIESANDFNLKNGGCYNGTATRYEECMRRNCPDYSFCPLMQAAKHTQETPIIILLHARYQRYMENMAPFMEWYTEREERRQRTLLLVDELPPLIENNAIDLSTLSDAEGELDRKKPSYNGRFRKAKSRLLFRWEQRVRQPFMRLMRHISSQKGNQQLITKEDLERAGFQAEGLKQLKHEVQVYAGETKAEKILEELSSDGNFFFTAGQTLSLSVPRLKTLHGKGQPATVLFSGTAALSPEVTENPHVAVLPDLMEESYERLTIMVQRGDVFNSSKTGMSQSGNFNATVEWLQDRLEQATTNHNKILLVTYKDYAQSLWRQLLRFHGQLVPYMAEDGEPKPWLPYFGGMNGSNAYQEATCIICCGLPRYDAQDYLARALAVDGQGQIVGEVLRLSQEDKFVRLAQLPAVMEAQDITLARDIVQLAYRSALRRHGETQPIELWLIQPPNRVVDHLLNYFGDCQVEEVYDFPLSCELAMLDAKSYNGKQPHWAKLLVWLHQWDGSEVTPEQIRTETGLTLSQFKEAKRHQKVQDFFDHYVITTGSGHNTRYIGGPQIHATQA